MNYRAWHVNHPDEGKAKRLAASIGATCLLARILVARGMDTPEKAMAFLTEEKPMSDPFLMADMDKAVERIRRAVDAEEPIVIFGDYDADGVTATALLFNHLQNMGATVRCKLPSREGDGYGLSKATLNSLAAHGYTLVVTVDNGISALEEAAYAASLGIDLVITDHHLPAETLPQAIAVVDPQRKDDTSPFKGLCGAGVAFKLCCALEGCAPEELLDYCSDLAAIGTVADVMPLVGENRTLVKAGLASLQNSERPGLQALIEAAGLGEKSITAESISFVLAPRINAAGRMDSAVTALRLLLCEEQDQAEAITAQLNQVNQERQTAEQEIMAQVEAILAADRQRANDRIILVWGENFAPGVIGIVASRLVERYARPAIVITIQDGEGKGSGRSVPGFNLHGCMAACQDLLIRFGGHALAAGLSVKEENLSALRKAMNAWAAKEYPVLRQPPLEMDVTVRLDDLSVEEVQGLDYLAPCGNGNPAPLFLLEGAQVEGVYPVSEGRHSRLRLRQGNQTIYAAYFGVGPAQLAYKTGDMVDVVLALSVYEGKTGAQLSGRVRDIRPAGLGNAAAEQTALFQAYRCGTSLTQEQRALLAPRREDVIQVYRIVQNEHVSAEDLQPLFARVGGKSAGRVMSALTALLQLGLIRTCEQAGSRTFAPVATKEKKDLASAPVLKALWQI